MDPSSVEGQPAELLRAREEFAAHELSFVGWYHSHPGDTQPRPSEKDVQMQTEMQNQVCKASHGCGTESRVTSKQQPKINLTAIALQIPHCVGIICSPHLRDNGCPEIAFNAFRTVLHMVCWTRWRSANDILTHHRIGRDEGYEYWVHC